MDIKSEWLIELASGAYDEISMIVKTPVSEYAKEYGVALERVEQIKLERIGSIVETQKFLLKKAGCSEE